MGSQDTHRLLCTPRSTDNRSEIDCWLEKIKRVVNDIPQPAFVDGTLHDVNRLKVASATLASRLEEVYIERSKRR
ncbi:MAG: hypothetical protein QG549_655 [Patescibacteria group bacterium]|nr:hypothetical protein [Patescibacteria group bacterium]